MSTITNVERIKDPITRKARGFIGHRALWFFLVLDEARKQKLDWEKFAPQAIYRCGLLHGSAHAAAAPSGAPKSLKILKKKLFGWLPRRVFEMEIKKSTDDELAVDFHYCPLVDAWRKGGASDEDIRSLCVYAMKGDAGIAESFGAELELGELIAAGGKVCQVRFARKV